MLSLNKSNDKTVASNDNLNNSSADDDGTASATIEHSDPNLRNGHISVETNSSKPQFTSAQHGVCMSLVGRGRSGVGLK